MYTLGINTVPLVFKSWKGPPLLGRPTREAPLTHEVVLLARQLPLPQRDRADRFLAATAQLAARSSGYTRAGQWALEELAGKVVALSFKVAPFGRAVAEDCCAAPSRGIAILSEWSHHDR